MSYLLESAWRTESRSIQEEAVAFWMEEGAVPDVEQARLRAQHLLIVARGTDGRIAAVSTAYKDVLHRFGFSLFSFQMYVGRKHRRPGLAPRILACAWEELNSRFTHGADQDALGIIIEISSEKAMRVIRDVIWRVGPVSFTYVGKSPRGFHQRIAYFTGGRVPI